MNFWQTCRICHELGSHDNMLRRGTRHWVHKTCYITSGKPLSALTRDQLLDLPFLALKKAGRIEEIEGLLDVQRSGLP
jgi:hypothetical protein